MANSENRSGTQERYQKEWDEIVSLLSESIRPTDRDVLQSVLSLLDSRCWRPDIRPRDEAKDTVHVVITEPVYLGETPRYIDLGIFPGDGATITIGYQLTPELLANDWTRIASASVQNMSSVELRTDEIVFSGTTEDGFGNTIVESASLDIDASVIHSARDFFPA